MVSVLGGLTLLWLVLTGWIGTIIISVSYFCILPFSRKFYRQILDCVAGAWFCAPLLFIEVICGTNIILYADDDGSLPPSLETAIAISNHRTRLDWMYMWGIFLRMGNLSREKIVLKAALKKVPMFGWATQAFRFLFLHRCWEKDEKHIQRVMKSYVAERYPIVLLIFPEGTDLSMENLELGHQFASKNNLPLYNNVLHPRTKGFLTCLRQLQQKDHLKAIYDITLGYPDVVPQSEKFLLNAQHPKELHVRIRRFEVNALFKERPDDAQLEEWCKERFAQKEAELELFKKNKKFQGQRVKNENLRYSTATIVGVNVGWLLSILLCVKLILSVAYVGAVILALLFTLWIASVVNDGLEMTELDWIEEDYQLKPKKK